MRTIGFFLAYSFLWLLSLLPERMFFLVSDLVSLFSYYVAGYRKKVVFGNLTKAFPEKSSEEIRGIAKKFYRHFADLILESAILHFYSQEKFISRTRFSNPELLRGLFEKGKQVIGVTAHYGNWEYLTSLGEATGYKILGPYKPLKNKYFDRMVRQNRERFNAIPVPMEKIARVMFQYHRDQIPALTLFVADQRPVFQHIQYWTKFLGQDTPVYLGPEKLARKLDAAVVFLKTRKYRRGRYEVETELICEEPGGMQPHEITDKHVRILESLIRERPEYWLWSHRRWKHSYERYLRDREARAPHEEKLESV
jgi:KDO2-lipid IV(A) lauroyltransferase